MYSTSTRQEKTSSRSVTIDTNVNPTQNLYILNETSLCVVQLFSEVVCNYFHINSKCLLIKGTNERVEGFIRSVGVKKLWSQQ